MREALPQLSRARTSVGAPNVLVPILLGTQGRPAIRAFIRHDKGTLGTVTHLDNWSEDLRNDIARLAEKHQVSDENALALDFEGIVQGCHRHG